MTSRKNKLSC